MKRLRLARKHWHVWFTTDEGRYAERLARCFANISEAANFARRPWLAAKRERGAGVFIRRCDLGEDCPDWRRR